MENQPLLQDASSNSVRVDFDTNPRIQNGGSPQVLQAYEKLGKSFFWRFLPSLNEQKWDELLKKIAASEPQHMALCLNRLKLSNITSALAGANPSINREVYEASLQFAASFQSRRPAIVPPRAPKQPSMMENLNLAFSYFSADHEPTNPWEAMSMLQVYGGMIAVPLGLTLIVDGVLVSDFEIRYYHRAYLFAGTLLLLGGFRAVIKAYGYFHRIPVQLKPLTNLTSEVLTGRVEPLLGRNHIIDRIFLSWKSTNETIRQHPLLVGPAGVGKTAIMTEVARRIALGEIPDAVKSTLKGKVVFGGTAATLLPTNQMFETEEKFERFLRRVLPIRKDIILAIDEVHTFMNDQYGFRYGELLKSLLDTSSRGLPYMMFSTTDNEYRKYIADDPARARRFLPIYVDSLSKADVLSILQHLIQMQYPGLPISEELLEYVYTKSEELCQKFSHLKQPEISKRVLTRAISKIAVAQERPQCADDLARKESELVSIQRKNFSLENSTDTSAQRQRLSQIQLLKKELSILNEKFTEQINSLNQFKEIVRRIDDCEEEIINLSNKISKCKKNRGAIEILNKRFYFIYYYLLPHLREFRKELIEKYQIPMLNQTTIDEIVNDLKESLEKVGKEEKQVGNKEEEN